MTNLSPNFTLAELTRTSQPYPNVPGPAEIAALTALCVNVIEPVRAHFGKPVRVNSGYRSQKVNAAVGSSPGSQHRKGEAGDIEIDGVSNADLAIWIRDHLAFDQVILENHKKGVPGSGWVHVSWSPAARKGGSKGINSVITMTIGAGGKPSYTAGINP
jgi:hypothetical protein